MFKIKRLGELHRKPDEAQYALSKLNSELGSVGFNPHDPASIETVIHSVCQMVDERVGLYAFNPIVEPLIQQTKKTYRQNILQKATEARLKTDEDQ